MAATRSEIRLAYRHLYQHLLQTVQYAKPYRRVVRDKLRSAFRDSPADSFNRESVVRTLEFLHNAKTHAGFEHRIMKNLVHVSWARWKNAQYPVGGGRIKDNQKPLLAIAYEQIDESIGKLNATMGLCLK